MICLFDKMETDFQSNSIVLTPSVCTVSEEAGGSYELYMEHPYDENGKYTLIAEDMIIRAPIPHTIIDEIVLPETTIYTVNTVSSFYRKLPVKRHKESEQKQIEFVRQNSADYEWEANKGFKKGDYVSYNGTIYLANKDIPGASSPSDSEGWTFMGTVEGTSSEDSTYIPGETYREPLTVGQRVRKVADYSDSWVQIRDSLGRVGYYAVQNLTATTVESETLPVQTIDEQLFRVYSIESEEDTHSIKVYARHISYDFAGNTLLDCKLEDTRAVDGLAVLIGNLLIPDSRTIACEFDEERITKDWSYRNPINALLDPDDGLIPALRAKLIRNNVDFYILKNDHPRKGIHIEYGVNLCGVTWNRSNETVVTRVVPRCSDKADGYVYLDSGGTWDDQGVWVPNNDIYVDSPIASEFPFPRIEVLDTGYAIGDKYTPVGSTRENEWTLETARADMLKQAQERFTKDHCDGVEITLNVEFMLLGDTEQYKQYKNLQYVNLYDEITVRTGVHEEISAQVTGYEYDCLMGRYNSIDVGQVNSFNKRVPGYRIVAGSITYSKLSPDLISRIRTMNSPSGSSSGSSGGGSPSSGYAVSGTVGLNTKDEAGVVAKGGTHSKKVWATDTDGNPAWRDLSELE